MTPKSRAGIKSCRVTGQREDRVFSCEIGSRGVMIFYTLRKKIKSLGCVKNGLYRGKNQKSR